MLLAEDWKDYELIDTGGGEKLERWGKYILRRPDPQAIWPVYGSPKIWASADAHYHRSSSGGGSWEYRSKLPEQWTLKYDKLSFYVEPTGFKHTGLFPEQAVNWKWMMNKITGAQREIKVLNLFAYTGGATVAAAAAGASVCHVDASKGMVTRAKENLVLSGFSAHPVRFIIDDALKFVGRESRRGNTYDAVIMDPPSYGRGPNGELWKIENEIFGLISSCIEILSENPLFMLVNSYTTGLSPTVIGNMLSMTMKSKFGGSITADEIGLPVTASGLVLPCGSSARWEADR
ncbi:MAG: SAM-dependent methyltransferase [Clostridiales bacterium]|nr:SAM-dependent methyltransferase [Clostridiales bacterium]